MMPNSIRWRLPASYGAIAFLTVLSLGVVLLLMLSSFYSGQERRYLEENAVAVSQMVGSLLQGPNLDSFPARDLVKSQISNLAFLTQSRIQLFNPEGVLLVDSGDPQTLRVASTLSLQIDLGEDGQSFSQSIGRETGEEKYTTALVIEDEGGRFESQTTISGNLIDPVAGVDGQALSLVGLQSPSALGLAEEPGIRTEEVVQQPIFDLTGLSLGHVVLSEGPAFGRAILSGVIRGLLIAGLIAVLFATSVGWLISQRLIRPVQALVDVTEKMSAGDLSVRAKVTRGDELGQLASSFNKMAERIEDTVGTLKSFVADAAHEMNTPLTALRTHLELAAKNGDSQLTGAIEQAARLESLNDDMLQLSRLEGGIGLEKMGFVDLGRWLAQLSERYAAQAEQAGLNFVLNIAQRPLVVEGDKELLSRAIENLIDNAVKFTPQGGRVTLSLIEDGSWATLTVADTGIGIEEADLDLVFSRFHRGRNAAEYPGNGLGLAIAHNIVETHGGQLEVESAPGLTQVMMVIPLIDPPGQ